MHWRKGHLTFVGPTALLQRFNITSLHQRFHDSRRRYARSFPSPTFSGTYQTSHLLFDSAQPFCLPESGFHLSCSPGFVIVTNFLDGNVRSTDFTKRNGMEGESIYGSPFADEDLSHELDSHGYVAKDCSHLPVSGACYLARWPAARGGPIRPFAPH